MYDEQITSCKELGYPIVYIDESGFIKDALRTHGYQAKGSRCQGVHDWQGKTVVQAIGALLEGYPTRSKGDFFRTRNFQTLTGFNSRNVLTRL
jgi:hypothetical protein